MLSVRTTDAWGFSVVVTVGAHPPETFTNAATANSAYDAMTAWIAWLNSGARGWTGAITFSWSWLRYPATAGGSLIVLSATAAFSIDAGANARLGLAAAAGVTSTTGAAMADGTFDPPSQLSLTRWVRHVDGEGNAAGAGAILSGVPGLAHRKPIVEAGVYEIDIGRLNWVLAHASRPRVGWLYHEQASAWRFLALGGYRVQRVDGYAWVVSLEVVG